MYHMHRATLSFQHIHFRLPFLTLVCLDTPDVLETSILMSGVMPPPGVRTTVRWAALVRNATRSVSVRTEPSVTTSTELVCVRLASKALIAKRDSAPRAFMASSVTSTAPVIPPTPWGKWDISTLPHTASFWPSPAAKPPLAPYE